jgi:ABC-2 type transport system ATP-binding protein
MEIAGVNVRSHPRRALEKIAAVLEGNRNIYWRLSPRENLEFFSGLQGIPTRRVRPYIDELIGRFRLQDKADVSARMLSRGMQQKLAVACALVKHTDILLLDEPTLGLDVETYVVQDVCDRVVIIHEGRVVTDDRVTNLLDLFRARAYRFRLEGRLSDAQCRKLQEEFALIHLHHSDHASEIEVELLRNDKLYQLMDILREGGSVIESIDRQDPNFEEIFLSIVRGGS